MKLKTTADLIKYLQATFPPDTKLIGAHPSDSGEEVEHNYDLTDAHFFRNDADDCVIDVQGITFMYSPRMVDPPV